MHFSQSFKYDMNTLIRETLLLTEPTGDSRPAAASAKKESDGSIHVQNVFLLVQGSRPWT